MQRKNTPTSVAEFIADRLAAIDKTQRQVATECGLENANVITMFKQGATKLPLNRIGPLAKALEVDPAQGTGQPQGTPWRPKGGCSGQCRAATGSG